MCTSSIHRISWAAGRKKWPQEAQGRSSSPLREHVSHPCTFSFFRGARTPLFFICLCGARMFTCTSLISTFLCFAVQKLNTTKSTIMAFGNEACLALMKLMQAPAGLDTVYYHLVCVYTCLYAYMYTCLYAKLMQAPAGLDTVYYPCLCVYTCLYAKLMQAPGVLDTVCYHLVLSV
jgi:hypothetical protein